MRAVLSYGIAGIIVLALAAWLVSGTFVAGGNGPGNGERPTGHEVQLGIVGLD